ncbi:MAG: DUF4423 domain-containing protein [Deltaproteobacteria bacterium]|nr:DUF4423 domain-containing protein [Deltaproteobacteria bacterium]
MSHTVLSLVLSGKRPLSKKAAISVAAQLALSPTEAQALFSSNGTTAFVSEPSPMDLDTFAVIAEWYHFAILSLLELPNARLEAQWIARQLNLSPLEAGLAIDRLIRLGIIAQNKDGRWRQTKESFRLDPRHSTTATRRFQLQLIQKAVESLENEPLEKRDHTSTTFAMDPALLPYAKARIQTFRRELTSELEQLGTPRQVFNLTVQLFASSKENS